MAKKRTEKKAAPSISQLARKRAKYSCDHLMGREVIEKQIAELAVGRIAKDYCQNWDRCPDNDWGKCSPDVTQWIRKIESSEYRKVFTEAEIKVVSELKSRKF